MVVKEGASLWGQRSNGGESLSTVLTYGGELKGEVVWF